MGVLRAKRESPCDQGVPQWTGTSPASSARSRPRTSGRSRSTRRSIMTRLPAFRRACWTATSSLTLEQATARSAVAASISQTSPDSARSRTGLGSSPDSKHVSMSAIWMDQIMPGTARTASTQSAAATTEDDDESRLGGLTREQSLAAHPTWAARLTFAGRFQPEDAGPDRFFRVRSVCHCLSRDQARSIRFASPIFAASTPLDKSAGCGGQPGKHLVTTSERHRRSP